jgi:hypothetical protein
MVGGALSDHIASKSFKFLENNTRHMMKVLFEEVKPGFACPQRPQTPRTYYLGTK